MTQNLNSLSAELRILAERPFPAESISGDPQTRSYGQRNNEFLRRCDVDQDFERLIGFGRFVLHLTGRAYSVLIARTLLKYLTLLHGSKVDAEKATHSDELSCFLSLFSVAGASETVAEAMQGFDQTEHRTLKKSAIAIRDREWDVFGRDVSSLDEIEDLIAWFDSRGRGKVC